MFQGWGIEGLGGQLDGGGECIHVFVVGVFGCVRRCGGLVAACIVWRGDVVVVSGQLYECIAGSGWAALHIKEDKDTWGTVGQLYWIFRDQFRLCGFAFEICQDIFSLL